MIELPNGDLTYDDWLEFFRKQPMGNIEEIQQLKNEMPVEGWAALKRWLEIIDEYLGVGK